MRVSSRASGSVGSFLDLVLELRRCPTLSTTVVPRMHPSYREVWLARLGYDRESYVAAVREALP